MRARAAVSPPEAEEALWKQKAHIALLPSGVCNSA